MDNIFAYTDDEDKCYGLTGMVISLEVLEENNVLQRVTLDASQDESITFTPDFYFCGNPRFSAKTAWNELLRQYQLMTGMIVSNVLCRYSLHRHARIDRDTIEAMRSLVADEGRDMCSLEDDEIDMLFNKTLRYMINVYDDMRVKRLASRLATVLLERRTLTGSDIRDEIHGL